MDIAINEVRLMQLSQMTDINANLVSRVLNEGKEDSEPNDILYETTLSDADISKRDNKIFQHISCWPQSLNNAFQEMGPPPLIIKQNVGDTPWRQWAMGC